MLLVIDKDNLAENRHRLDEAFRLRHRIFVEEAGWEALRRSDGRETDQFDTEEAIHFLAYDGEQLVGYQRLLPTTRPYLLTDIYPELCDGTAPRDKAIYEWTRFAVERTHRGDGQSLGQTGAELVLGYVEWGLENGVSAVVVELEPIQTVKFIQCRFLAAPLGVIHRIGGRDTLAMLAHFDERTRSTLRHLLGRNAAKAIPDAVGSGDVLHESDPQPFVHGEVMPDETLRRSAKL